MSETRDWLWYWAPDVESSWTGPFTTRDEAERAGHVEREGASFFVAQAINPPEPLSDWIEADTVLERANEHIFDCDRAFDEWDDEIFHATSEQVADLNRRLKQACDDWQQAHGLTFKCNTFKEMTAPIHISARKASNG